jgi:hypothetical protein
MKINLDQWIDSLISVNHDLYLKFFPRKYIGVNGYGNPKRLSAYLMTLHVQKLPDVDIYYKNILKTVSANLALQYMPFYWVKKDILDSCEYTDLPTHLSPADILLPLDNYILMIPKGYLMKGDVDYPFLIVASGVNLSGEKVFQIHALHDSNLPDASDYYKSMNFSNKFSDILPYGGSFTSDDDMFLKKAVSMAINVTMVMATRPELIDEDYSQIIKPPQQKINGKKPYNPNWVGRNYRVKSDFQGGTHSSPCIHWRRGHWRQQAVGVGRSLRRNMWIEPMLVGARNNLDLEVD